jgi:hypothetical protein
LALDGRWLFAGCVAETHDQLGTNRGGQLEDRREGRAAERGDRAGPQPDAMCCEQQRRRRCAHVDIRPGVRRREAVAARLGPIHAYDNRGRMFAPTDPLALNNREPALSLHGAVR